jgi:hypothetical protein
MGVIVLKSSGGFFSSCGTFIHMVAVFSCNGFMVAWRDMAGSAILELHLVFGPPVLRKDMIDDTR